MGMQAPVSANTLASPRFLGLAPYARMSVAGADMRPIAQQLLALAEHQPDDANLWMNLSTLMFCLNQRDLGLAMQEQALQTRRVYELPAARQPAAFRLLMLMVPGDLAANTPLDCLLEDSDIDLVHYYLRSADDPLDLPEHDALMLALSEVDENRELLTMLERRLAAWPKPVINAAQHIPSTGRANACRLLQEVPGLLIPPTLRAARDELLALAGEADATRLGECFPGCAFPLIMRPVGSQAGRDLEKIDGPVEMAGYLARVAAPAFFISSFIDYRSPDGLFRKFRVALIDGQPFASHMGISADWMIHYVNAGMYDDAGKRAEEAAFMENFADFAARHRVALAHIHKRTGLDYVCIDCAETRCGSLLIFEVDHVMVVHAMDPVDLFPYKQVHMQKLKNAFREFLFRLKPLPAMKAES